MIQYTSTFSFNLQGLLGGECGIEMERPVPTLPRRYDIKFGGNAKASLQYIDWVARSPEFLGRAIPYSYHPWYVAKINLQIFGTWYTGNSYFLSVILPPSNGNLVAMLIHVCSEIVLIEWPGLRTVRAISHSHNYWYAANNNRQFSGCCTQELLLALCV